MAERPSKAPTTASLLRWLALLPIAGGLLWAILRLRDLSGWLALSRRDWAERHTATEDDLGDLRARLAALEDRFPPLVGHSLDTLTVGQLLTYRPEQAGVLLWLGLTPDRLGPEGLSLLLPEAAHRAEKEWPAIRSALIGEQGQTFVPLQMGRPAPLSAR